MHASNGNNSGSNSDATDATCDIHSKCDDDNDDDDIYDSDAADRMRKGGARRGAGSGGAPPKTSTPQLRCRGKTEPAQKGSGSNT